MHSGVQRHNNRVIKSFLTFSKRYLKKYHHLFRISVCNPFTIKLPTYDHLTARRRPYLPLR